MRPQCATLPSIPRTFTSERSSLFDPPPIKLRHARTETERKQPPPPRSLITSNSPVLFNRRTLSSTAPAYTHQQQQQQPLPFFRLRSGVPGSTEAAAAAAAAAATQQYTALQTHTFPSNDPRRHNSKQAAEQCKTSPLAPQKQIVGVPRSVASTVPTGGGGGFQQSRASSAADPIAVLLSLEGVRATGGPKYANQDRAFIHEVTPTFTAFAVFDGHGEYGHLVADFVCNTFRRLLQTCFPPDQDYSDMKATELLSWLQDCFAQTDEALISSSGISISHSGSTASIAVRFGNKVYVGYVGDSKVAGFQFDGKKPFCLVETPEHNPSSEKEWLRIRSTGSTVVECSVQYFSKNISRIVEAGLSVSRSFGDMAARQHGVISIPDFIEINVPPEKPSAGKPTRFPLVLMVASDGLWDTVVPNDVLAHISNATQSKNKLFSSTRRLAETAWRRRLAAEGRADDTTVIVALLR